MFTAAGSGQLANLLTLMEYMSDPKESKKEIKALLEAIKKLDQERMALIKACGGAKKLEEADKVLAGAQTAASNILSEAHAECEQMRAGTKDLIANLKSEKQRLETLNAKLGSDRDTFEKTMVTTITELARREKRATQSEKNVARGRDDLTNDIRALQKRTADVAQVMKG